MRTASASVASASSFSAIPLEFLNAKLRGRRSALFEGDRLRQLAQVPDFPELLWRVLPREEIADEVDFERVLTARCAEELFHLRQFASGAAASLYDALLSRFAIANLKVLVRLALREAEPTEAERLLIPLPPQAAIPPEQLLGAPSAERLVEMLPAGPLRRRASTALEAADGIPRRAALEMAIDAAYWEGVMAVVNQMPPSVRRLCTAPVRTECAAAAVMTVLRASVTYGVEWNALAPLLPPGSGIPTETLSRIHREADPGAAARLLGRLTRTLPQGATPTLGELEDALWSRVMATANAQYYCDMTGPAALISYFYLKYDETRRLCALAYLKSRGASQEAVLEHVMA